MQLDGCGVDEQGKGRSVEVDSGLIRLESSQMTGLKTDSLGIRLVGQIPGEHSIERFDDEVV